PDAMVAMVPNNIVSSSADLLDTEPDAMVPNNIVSSFGQREVILDNNTLPPRMDTLASRRFQLFWSCHFDAMTFNDNTTSPFMDPSISIPAINFNYNVVSSPVAMDPNYDSRPIFSPSTGRRAKSLKKELCRYCNKRFRHFNELQDHVYSKHRRDQNPYKCSIEGCKKFNKLFSGKNSFRRHYKDFHSDKSHPILKKR
ncbi:32376_t:CDS:2, partial [Racocetra persica]